MEIYECILSLIAGVGVFILAMKLMSDSLNQIAGNSMKNLLEKLAGDRIKGVLIGALVTAIIQSSSATTVMVIGFVNADVMNLNQAAAIIIGSNIGTTATSLLASLESLNVSLYLSLLVFMGVMLAFIKKIKKIANLMTGLGMIFVGLKMMSNACNDDSIKNAFTNVLEKLQFPLILEFLGIIFTAIIQSSSAMTGIIIIMVQREVMTMRNALFITLGANVGTCVTALIGIIGANTNSKRTALIHFIFNISGLIIFTPILWIFADSILSILDSLSDENAMKVAYFHLAFNITTALITTPLIKYLVKLVTFLIKEKEAPKEFIEWFIKDKNEKNALMSSRPSCNSINISFSKDLTNESLNFTSNQTDQNDDTIIKDENEIKSELFRKSSSDISDKIINFNKNKINEIEEKNENIIEKLKGEENIDEIKVEEENKDKNVNNIMDEEIKDN